MIRTSHPSAILLDLLRQNRESGNTRSRKSLPTRNPPPKHFEQVHSENFEKRVVIHPNGEKIDEYTMVNDNGDKTFTETHRVIPRRTPKRVSFGSLLSACPLTQRVRMPTPYHMNSTRNVKRRDKKRRKSKSNRDKSNRDKSK